MSTLYPTAVIDAIVQLSAACCNHGLRLGEVVIERKSTFKKVSIHAPGGPVVIRERSARCDGTKREAKPAKKPGIWRREYLGQWVPANEGPFDDFWGDEPTNPLAPTLCP